MSTRVNIMKTKLTQEYLKEALHYNPDTGVFTWNERPLSHFKNIHWWNNWNSKYANKEAGHIDKRDGYLSIMLNSKLYKSHRLSFLYQEGYFPENQVDHMDRNRSNNKWDNLREASSMCNQQNCNISKNNTSGVTGVSWKKRSNKWESRIMINSKYKHLGYFLNFNDAVRARYQAEIDNQEWTCSIESTSYIYLKERNLI
jgi:hypothetical protein